MASAGEWLEGARLRTLPASVAPVVAGIAAAWFATGVGWPAEVKTWLMALLCLVVSLGFQIGGNFANDYSDGIRGTDSDRVGPMRLVGSGAAPPAAVKRAAGLAFAVACLAGLALIVLAFDLFNPGTWPLTSSVGVPLLVLAVVGLGCLLAAWFYTGGRRPYGYIGLGEVFVFVFFGLVPVIGTAYVLAPWVVRRFFDSYAVRAIAWWPVVLAGVVTGALSTAILVANNLRDLQSDKAAGKITLPVRLGEELTRWLYLGCVILAALCLIVIALLTYPYALLSLVGLALVVPSVTRVLTGATGRDLITVLKWTGLAELAAMVLLGLGWGIGCYA